MAVVGITGSYGGLNMGDEAILTAMLTRLRADLPGDELVVFSRNAQHTQQYHRPDRVVAAREMTRDAAVPEVERLDLLLLGGGGILYDTEARTYLRDVRLAQERGIPTMAFAVGVGPLDDATDRAAVLEALEAADAVTVRDATSKRILEDLGLQREVEVVADPAVLLTKSAVQPDVLAGEGFRGRDTLVGMSVREPGRAATDLDEEGYHQLLAHAADFVVHRYGGEVVLVPMESDDVRHSHAVAAHMRAADHAHVLNRLYDPRQLLDLVGQFEFLVGMRLHLLMLAAVAGVPFLPLPYARKVFDFVERVGIAAPAPAHRSSAGPLLAALDRMWDDREALRDALRRHVPGLKEQAGRAFTIAETLLAERAGAPEVV